MARAKAAQKMTKAATVKSRKAFSGEEMGAMRARAREARHAQQDGESDVLAAIAAMPAPDRVLAERFHRLVKATAPGLTPKTWYGMPAYAENGSVICHFQAAQKFKTRYATIGFSDKAKLDEGNVWPVAYALKSLTGAEEARIAGLVKKAVS